MKKKELFAGLIASASQADAGTKEIQGVNGFDHSFRMLETSLKQIMSVVGMLKEDKECNVDACSHFIVEHSNCIQQEFKQFVENATVNTHSIKLNKN